MKLKLVPTLFALAATSMTIMASPAIAATAASAMLVSATPSNGATVQGSLETITLSFAEPVTMISLALILPDESEKDVYELIEPSEDQVKSGKAFTYKLTAPVTAPGQYKISYLITSKSFRSLNGFVDFEIAVKGEATTP